MTQQPLLKIQNLSLRFGSQANSVLNQINLQIHRGETLALVGESGSGKTLTGYSILRLLPRHAQMSRQSQIWFSGGDSMTPPEDLLNLSEIAMRKIRGKRIGLIFQEASTAFNPVLTIGQQITENLRCHASLSAKQIGQRILSLLDEVGISNPEHCANTYPHTLSGGMRQRAMIAMALVLEPELLIADEPTTAVDVTLQAQILALLRHLQQKNNMAMLFITHDLGIVYEMADRVAVIAKGALVEQQPVASFFKQPQHVYSQQLFAALPQWGKRLAPPLPRSEQQPLLTVENMKIYFPIKKGLFQRTEGYIKAVDNVSFSIESGQTFALVGESGSGKTTIAKGILRLVSLRDGRVQFSGESISHLPMSHARSYRRYLQMIFQDPYASLNPRLRISEIIAEGMLAQKVVNSLEQCQPEIDRLLERVHLPISIKNRFPHEFSGGQRQRICIARALAMKPKLIICDEPTSALDVVVQMEILHLLHELQQIYGLSYLLITHNIAVVAFLADYVGVMHRGRIVEQGGVEQILFRPQQAYTRELLKSVPKYDLGPASD